MVLAGLSSRPGSEKILADDDVDIAAREEGPAFAVAEDLLREGWRFARARRFARADRAALIASFLGDVPGAEKLRAFAGARRSRFAGSVREEERDCLEAGDIRRAERLSDFLLRVEAAPR